MEYDRHQQRDSSGALVAVVGVGLVLAILAIVVVAAAGLLWVRASTQQVQAAAEEQIAIAAFHQAELQAQRAAAEAERAEVEARQAITISQLGQSRTVAEPNPGLDFEVEIDAVGRTSVDGKKIDLDELKAKLVKLKDETSNACLVQINADSECPVKHVVAVVALCDEIGDVDYRIKSSAGQPRE